MTEILFGAGLTIVTGFVFHLGLGYIRGIKMTMRSVDAEFDKQMYVKKNRTQFGISDTGSSIDGRKIYAINPSDFGL